MSNTKRVLAQHMQLPVVPLFDVVMFPHMVLPVMVSREESQNTIDLANAQQGPIVFVSQRDPNNDSQAPENLYNVATVGEVIQVITLPDGKYKVLIEGTQRVKIDSWLSQHGMLFANVSLIADSLSAPETVEPLIKTTLSQFEQYVKTSQALPLEMLADLNTMTDIGRLIDIISGHMTFKLTDKQALLEEPDLRVRFVRVIELLEAEIAMLDVEKKVRGDARDKIDKNQREYYLHEQMKAIQKELDAMDSPHGGEAVDELAALQEKIKKAKMPKKVESKMLAEVKKLRMMPPMSSETAVIHNYVDWMLKMPWQKASKIKHDLTAAETVLNDDHYALEKVKQRILEYLAVSKRVKKMQGPILCLVGPPGVGKTSLGRSIARATGREFARFSLGGIRDEAEIRGHRRTYVGAMPGKIMQMMAKTGSKNPLILLDEIDKMAMDFRGDPASALLEVLDSEQNNTFNDHYLEVDYDLSNVMFVATANSMNIPEALLDRMEVIRLAGYTEDEKQHIAKQYLLPKQIKNNGVKDGELTVSDNSLRDIIRYYTREAGVRNLEREIAKLCRKTVKELVTSKKTKNQISPRQLDHYLGVKRYRYGLAEKQARVGQVTGLAWTQVGGELLTIEVASVRGKGSVQRTGNLENVMKESITAAITVIRMRSESLGVEMDFNQTHDVHFHVPEGAIKKDGPSAGIGMCVALTSSLTGIPVRADVAMTGEITLRGEVLPIGGLKEKLLAAHRGGIKHVIIPHDNERDLADIPENVKKKLTIHPVQWIDEVLTLALTEIPQSKTAADKITLSPEKHTNRMTLDR